MGRPGILQEKLNKEFLYEESAVKGKSPNQIGEETHCNPTTVYIYLRRFKITRRPTKIFTKEFLEEEYIVKGKTVDKIAEEINLIYTPCSRKTIIYYLKKFGIPIRQPIKLFIKEFLEEEYIVKGKSTIKIAEENNCTPVTVVTYLKIFGMPRNRVKIGFNDLLSQRPNVVAEWDYTKNAKKPDEVAVRCHKKVWWICSRCGHNWKATPGHRADLKNPRRCPKCNESKGEKRIAEILDKYNIKYEQEKWFDDCRNKKPLRFDFYLLDYNIPIEYQGIQHYEPIKAFGGKKAFKRRQKRDKIKQKYCQKNKIPLIAIPYTEFDNIETILQKKLNLPH